MQVQEPKELDNLLLLCWAHWEGTGWEVEQPGVELAPTWDVSASGGGLTYRAKAQNPPVHWLSFEVSIFEDWSLYM